MWGCLCFSVRFRRLRVISESKDAQGNLVKRSHLVFAIWLVGLFAAVGAFGAPTDSAPAHAEWVVILRSDSPAIWDKDVDDGPNRFAVSLNRVDSGVRWLRMTRTDTGEAIIIPIRRDDLVDVARVTADVRWNGRDAQPGRGELSAGQLGIANRPWQANPRSGRIIVLTMSGSSRRGWTGWGFGQDPRHRSVQGYCWGGEAIAKTVFEIAVKGGSLEMSEQHQRLRPSEPDWPQLGPMVARDGVVHFSRLTDTIEIDKDTLLGGNCTYEAVVYFPRSDGAKGAIFTEHGRREKKFFDAGPSFVHGNGFGKTFDSKTDKWMHVAYVLDGRANEERLYVDGRLIARRKTRLMSIGNFPGTGFIGASLQRSTQQTFKAGFIGYLDSIRISNRAVYTGEQFVIPTGDLSVSEDTELLYQFRPDDFFWQDNLLKVRDLSGNDRHGTFGIGFEQATVPTPIPAVPTTQQARVKAPSTQPAAVATQPTTTAAVEQIDLLKAVVIKRDCLSGEWSIKDDGLWMAGGRRPKLMFPIVPKGDYELHMELTISKGSSLSILLPVDGGSVQLHIGRTRARLEKLANAESYSVNGRLAPGEGGVRRKLVVRVRSSGEIAHLVVEVDGHVVLDWRGRKDHLTVNPDDALPKHAIGLTNWSTTVLFHTIELRAPRGTTRAF